MPIKDNGDGTFTISDVVEVVSSAPPNNMVIALKKAPYLVTPQGVMLQALSVSPYPTGVAMINSWDNDEFYVVKISTPTGRYVINARVTQNAVRPEVQILFNVP